MLPSVFGEQSDEISEQLREWRASESGRRGAFSPVLSVPLRGVRSRGNQRPLRGPSVSNLMRRIVVSLALAVYESRDDGWELSQWHIIREGSR